METGYWELSGGSSDKRLGLSEYSKMDKGGLRERLAFYRYRFFFCRWAN